MDHDYTSPGSPPDRASRAGGWLRPASVGVAGLAVGAVLAGTLAAGADESGADGSGDTTARGGPDGANTTQPRRSDEELLTGATAAKVEQAAVAEYPGATVLRIETDSDGVYEAHLVTAQGEPVTVEVGEDLTVTGTEAAQPGPRGSHGPEGDLEGPDDHGMREGQGRPDDHSRADDQEMQEQPSGT
ncbi:MAG: PepSY domain-containing protein [Nocardioidaceae bacterium]